MNDIKSCKFLKTNKNAVVYYEKIVKLEVRDSFPRNN